MGNESIRFGKSLVTTEELLTSGHRACSGCGSAVIIRLSLKALGSSVVIGTPAGCWSVAGSIFPHTAWQVPWMQTLFENAAATISGTESGFKILMEKGRMLRREINCVVIAGDGATNDIGVSALSGALERGHDFLYICLDNEAYMNTGTQRSSATPYGASTTTTPVGKFSRGRVGWKKDMVAIVAAHDIPYVATACPSYPFDLMGKIKRGAKVKGPAYIHILSPCPTGWRFPSNMTIEMGRLAVQTGAFPIYEIENGCYKLNISSKLRPIEEYLKPQGRFRHLTNEEIGKVQEEVNRRYTKLLEKAQT